jgi:hypothetical protein
MLSLMSPVLSIRIPPLMLLLHLWLTLCLCYLFPMPLLFLCLFFARLYRPLSSSESPLVVSDYTVKPPVTQFYSCHGARLSNATTFSDELSSDVSSSSFIKDVPSFPPVEPFSLTDSSSEQLVRHSHRLRMPPDCYSPKAFTTTALSKPASYYDAILHPEWQHAMTEEIAALERTGTWDLVPCPQRVRLITCKWVYKVKTCSDGSLERYKARFVAHGF